MITSPSVGPFHLKDDPLPLCSLLCRGLFVLWGGWGERKIESAGHKWEGEREKAPTFSLFLLSPRCFLFFSITAVFIGIPSGMRFSEGSLICVCTFDLWDISEGYEKKWAVSEVWRGGGGVMHWHS